MLPQESFLEHKEMHDTTDELYETLSLCDLPLYGDQSVEEWEKDLSADSQGSTSMSSDDHDDYFEFFSHELTHPTPCFPPENIIFCDKIIACKQQPDASDALPTKEVEIKQPTGVKKKRGWSLFGWRFGAKCTSTTQTSKKKHSSSKQGKGYGFPLNKMPILTSSQSAKARWFLFLSGISRYSSKMELRDIKNRQSRRHSPNPQPSLTWRFQNHDEKAAGDMGRGSSGLWAMVRVLSCGGSNDPNSLVVGSISATG
ncbi:hypothetical protein SASPL_151215 [Salvia splendens]|uniref:Uncharacterized protein n=1 Tax=Salvia splendens TaxID=180675 RepID=A0A8X8Z2G8_SALSN|nr:hypothetical protein SASPL_151215 [Salvia splendens]